jgi:hypothetical protein
MKNIGKKISILDHIEKITEKIAECCGNNNSTEFDSAKVKTHINEVSRKLDLTHTQALLFACFVGRCFDTAIKLSEVASDMNWKSIKMMKCLNDIKELQKRKFIKFYCSESSSVSACYQVPKIIVEALLECEFTPPAAQILDIDAFFEQLSTLFGNDYNEFYKQCDLFQELEDLVKQNDHLEICKVILKHDVFGMNETALLLYFCHRSINERDDDLCEDQIKRLFQRRSEGNLEWESFRSGCHRLIRSKFVGYVNDEGLGDRERLCLTEEAKKTLFAELGYNPQKNISRNGLTQHDSLAAKTMYYNDEEQRHIKRLTDLLEQENFKNVQQRLAKSGMRTGFCCLFYGMPGTGKTESVYQIAKQTGRDIMQVDISNTKSCWFGGSEKKIKELFETYRNYVKNNDIAPILLFNEADAVFGRRKDVGSSNVAQTENAMQNIILQELETLSGILIATTNLTQNLDSAFERRFLYKVEFKKPSLHAKRMLWKTMLPSLSDAQAQELAQRYDFSGGQIENISRKRAVDNIILGKEPDIAMLHDYCKSEMLNKKSGHGKVGF